MSANPGNVVGGHKANLNDPNTSEQSKPHSCDMLENADKGGDVEAASKAGGEKNPKNVAGGLKAALSSPNTFDEAKQSAKERLADM